MPLTYSLYSSRLITQKVGVFVEAEEGLYSMLCSILATAYKQLKDYLIEALITIGLREPFLVTGTIWRETLAEENFGKFGK